MSLFINCQWFPESNASLAERIEIIIGLFSNSAITALIGGQWYRLGRSSKQALSKPFLPSELRQINTWRFTQLSADSGYYGIGLWNGSDIPKGVTLTLEINTTANRLDTLVIDGPEIAALRADVISWDIVLSCGRYIAEQLGGLAVVSSHELIDYARKNSIEGADLAAYAAFWAIDRSEKNPGYIALMQEDWSLPFSMVICMTWEDVKSPNLNRIRELIRLLRS